jgi:hypothetical protein
MGDAWLDEVRVKLATLARLDPDCQVFGAGAHRYQLEPCATADALDRFERAHDLTLPADYRAFLREVGNGGAGPMYGLAPLEPWRPDEFSQVVATVTTRDGASYSAGTGPRPGLARPADPSMPFRLDGPWRPCDDDGAPNPPPGPADANPYDGCAYLAEIGCGYFYFLVIKGERAGEVWADYTAGDGALTAVAPSFQRWYEDWLDAELASQLLLRIQIALRAGPDWQESDEVLVWAALLERRVARQPDDPQAVETLAFLRLYQRRPAEADATIARLAALAPEKHALDELRYLLHRDEIDAAADPATPAARLVELARSPVDEVRRAAAGNPHTPIAELARLIDRALAGLADAPRESGVELDLYARHPGLDAALIERLLSLDADPPGWHDAAVRAAARHPALAPDRLRQLAAHRRPWIREAALAADAVPDDLLAAAAADPDPVVRRAVASHPRTAEAALRRLAEDCDGEVIAAVAAHPNAPDDVLVALACGCRRQLARLAENPRLPAALAVCLAHAPEPAVRQTIARHPSLSPLVRGQLARDPDRAVRTEVALWIDDDDVTLRLLSTDPEEVVRAAVAVHPRGGGGSDLDVSDQALRIARARSPHTAVDALAALAGDEVAHVREAVARNPRTPADALDALGRDELLFVREAVPRRRRGWAPLLRQLLADPRKAADPDVPVVALAELARSDDDLVPYAVAAHPWAPPELLDRLAGHRYDYTRLHVAAHPSASADTLARLRVDRAAMVRAGVARNPRAPAEWLPALAADAEAEVREAVAARPELDPALLAALVGDPERYVRRGVACNPAAPTALLTRLARDPDPHVREWACWGPRLPAAETERLLADENPSVVRAARFRQLVAAL